MSRKKFCFTGGLVFGLVFLTAYALHAEQPVKGSDRILSKITFIHYKKGHAKPTGAGGGKGHQNTDGIYNYIARGAKWKITEDLFLNPSCGENLYGELDGVISSALLAGMEEWETAGDASLEIFGNLYIDEGVSYDDGAFRGYNTLSFGSYANPDVIAITTVWGYFSGPPSHREIVEAHMLMNDDFVWGDASFNLNLMDVQNIVTHELGHWAGMGDVYESTGSEETMYGYSGEGELKKRDLYFGDIAGITNLYK
jgi:hypothetical protein